MIGKKKITPEQLDKLFVFMRRKRVRYYDLQVELVDHFASAIEAIWREDPDLSFERAIERVYDDFPITGFASIIEKQTAAMQKEAWRWVYRVWKSYFAWPRLLLSITLVLAVRLFFFLPVSASWLLWTGSILTFIPWAYILYQKKISTRKGRKKFLRLEATYSVTGMFINVFYPLFILFFGQVLADLNTFPAWAAWSLSLFFTYFGFLFYILFFKLPTRTVEDLRRRFPQYI